MPSETSSATESWLLGPVDPCAASTFLCNSCQTQKSRLAALNSRRKTTSFLADQNYVLLLHVLIMVAAKLRLLLHSWVGLAVRLAWAGSLPWPLGCFGHHEI